MRVGWLLACCLFGCGAEIGGDSDSDARPAGQDAAVPADASAAGSDAAPVVETTVFAVPDVVDTFVRLTDPTLNFGSRDRMCADTTTDDRRILLRIDVSALPVGAEVVHASLHIWTGTSTNDLSPQTFSFYRMLEDWSEGNQDGLAGAASWNERKAGTAWTVAGAGVGSREDVVIGSFIPAALDTEYVVELAPEIVAGWVADAASNFGIIMVAAGENGACFDTTEHATVGKHPTLVVDWAAP